MNWLKKILLSLVGLILVLISFVLSMRWVNDQKYGAILDDYQSELVAQYVNPRDLSLYQTEIPGLEIEHLEGDYLKGFHIKPETVAHRGIVVTFGESEGSPAYEDAVALAQEGYQVLSLFFWHA